MLQKVSTVLMVPAVAFDLDALNAVAPEKDLKGLSPLEYCQMCIYYDS